MSTTLHNISGSSGMDVRRYGRLLAKFTPKVIETEDENEEALAVVESLLKRGESRLSTEELALLDLLGTLIEKFERSAYNLPNGDAAGALEVLMEGRGLNLSTWRRCWDRGHAFPKSFRASGPSAKIRPKDWENSSESLPSRSFKSKVPD